MTPPQPPGHELRRSLQALALAALAMALLLELPALHFKLPPELNAGLHAVLEMSSIAVSAIVFAVGWNSYGRGARDTDAAVWLAFLVVALLDGLHTLSFEGMPAFFGPSGRGKAIFFFLVARTVAALAVLQLSLPRRVRPLRPAQARLMLAAALLLAAAVAVAGLTSDRLRLLFFVPGEGLTPFKKGCEYAVLVLNLAAVAGFLRHSRAARDPQAKLSWPLLLLASGLMALSEWALTRYTATSDGYNLAGHVYKTLAYLVIYRAVAVRTVSQPLAALDSARLELVTSQQEYRELFEASLDGIVVMVYDGPLVAINAAGRQVLGYTVEEANALGGVRALHMGQDPRSRAFAAELQRARRAHGRVAIRCRRGPVEIEASANLYQLPSGQDLVCIIFRDITEQIRQEQEIRELNASLERRVAGRTAELLRRNRDLEGLAYALAHDLRGDIGRVQGFAQALAEVQPVPDPALAQRWLERLQANIRRMHDTADGLLALASVSTATVRPADLDLAELARASLQRLREAEPGREVEVRIAGPLPARGDPRLLAVAMDNLLGNAWKFTRGTAGAWIEVGRSETVAGGPAWFVRDNGAGFDMAQAGRLFGLFQRLHSQEQFGGHGVGLATLQRIVEHHQGRIWAQAQPGQGATFYFTLGPS